MVEYSAMSFAMFYLAEFLHAFLVSVLFSVLFLGGWQGPFVDSVPALGIIYISTKSFLVYFVMLWIRMTLPRFRIDHLMAFNWKFLVPISIVNLLLVGFFWKLIPDGGASGNIFQRLVEEFPRMAIMGGVSLALGYASLYLLRQYAINSTSKTTRFHCFYSICCCHKPTTGHYCGFRWW